MQNLHFINKNNSYGDETLEDQDHLLLDFCDGIELRTSKMVLSTPEEVVVGCCAVSNNIVDVVEVRIRCLMISFAEPEKQCAVRRCLDEKQLFFC